MADPVPPVPATPAASEIRHGRMLVVREQVEDSAGQPDSPPRPRSAGSPRMAAVGAQLLDERPRRGLRAGPEILEQARSTYLQNEYAGPRDRRPRKGQLTRTDV
jgi:hypothetical protein